MKTTHKQGKKRQTSGLLWDRDPRLNLAKQVLDSEDNWLNMIETEFVNKSVKKRDFDRKRNWFLVAIAFLVISGFGFVQWKQNQEAQSLNLVSSSKTRFTSDQQLEALVESIKAGRTLKRVIWADAETTHKVSAVLLQTILNVREQNRLQVNLEKLVEFGFSLDGNTLALKDTDGSTRYLNLEGEEISLANDDAVLQPCNLQEGSSYSLDGKIQAKWNYDGYLFLYLNHQGEWQEIWNVKALRGGHNGQFCGVYFSPNGQTIASVSSDGTVKLWSVEGEPITGFQAHRLKVNSVKFSSDGKKLASAGDDEKFIKIWSLEDKEPEFLPANGDSVLSIDFSPDGRYLAYVNDADDPDKRVITLWDSKENKFITIPDDANDLSFSPDGKILASAGNDGKIEFWNLEGQTARPEILAHTNIIYSVSFSPDGQMLVSSAKEGAAKLWNLSEGSNQQGEEIGFANRGPGQYQTVKFSPDGEMLAFDTLEATNTGEAIGRFRLLSMDGEELVNFVGSPATLSPDSKIIASGSREGNIKLWSIEGEEIATLRRGNSPISSLSFSPDGKMLVSASEDGEIVLSTLDLDELLSQACTWARGYLKNSPNVSESDRHLCDGIKPFQLPEQIQLLEQTPKFSMGEHILISTLTSLDKQAGVEAIRNGDFATAIQHLEAHLKSKPNDPEALIYLNNARIGTQTSYTIAISAPIGSDVNGALEMLRGVAQAQNEINQSGGINQVPLRVLIANDDNKPDTAQQIAKALVNNPDVLGVVGHYASDVTLAAGEVYESGKLVAISPVSTSVKLTGFGDYIFRTVPSDSVAAKTLADYMRSQLRKRSAAVFYNSQSGYSESLKSEFVNFLSEAGGQVSNPLVFDLSDPNFNAEQSVEQSIKSGAEVLVLLPNTSELDDTLQVVKANNRRLPLLAGDDVYTPKTLETGAANAEDMIVAVPWHILASSTNFPTTSRQLWRADVNWRTAMSYDATLALTTGLHQNPTREGIAQILRSQGFSANGATGAIQFDPSGDRDRDIQLVKIKNTGTASRSGFGYDFAAIPNSKL